MYVCIHTCMYIHYTYVYLSISLALSLSLYIYIYIYTYMYIHTFSIISIIRLVLDAHLRLFFARRHPLEWRRWVDYAISSFPTMVILLMIKLIISIHITITLLLLLLLMIMMIIIHMLIMRVLRSGAAC